MPAPRDGASCRVVPCRRAAVPQRAPLEGQGRHHAVSWLVDGFNKGMGPLGASPQPYPAWRDPPALLKYWPHNDVTDKRPNGRRYALRG